MHWGRKQVRWASCTHAVKSASMIERGGGAAGKHQEWRGRQRRARRCEKACYTAAAIQRSQPSHTLRCSDLDVLSYRNVPSVSLM